MSETKKRKIWTGEIECVQYHGMNSVKVENEIVVPAEAAETRVIVTVEKATTTRLSDYPKEDTEE
jgi:hypothetical protein